MTLMELIKKGELKAKRIGRKWFIRKEWIEEFLEKPSNQGEKNKGGEK